MAISPGWLRSEEMLESPRFTGRAVVALASDPDVGRWNCRTMYAEQLAVEYGFTDLNGETPGQGIYSVAYTSGGGPFRRDDYNPTGTAD